MTAKFCSGCGAPLRPDTVICPNCGKVVSGGFQRPAAQRPAPSGGVRVRAKQAAPKQTVVRTSDVQTTVKKKKLKQSRIKNKTVRIVCRAATVALIVAALYVCIFAVQVFRVKISKYDFKTQMKLSSSCYGEAIESYFESGKWSVNPFNGTCTYTGETKDSEECRIVFTARISVGVEDIYIDGEKVSEKQKETRLMSMFI